MKEANSQQGAKALVQKSTNRILTLKHSFVLMCLILVYGQAYSQTIPVLSSSDKMIKPPSTNSYTSVRCTLQDKAGNLWFATTGAGVYRYDGKSFTNFTEKDGLLSRVVFCIIEDKAGNIWAGTDNGVYRYNGKRFSHFPLRGIDNTNYNFFHKPPLLSASLKIVQQANPVYTMISDKIGNIWFGTGKYGLVKYNGQSFTNFNYHGGQWKMVPKDSVIFDDEYYRQSVQNLLEDSKGNIWFSSMSYGIHRYDGKTITKFVTDKPTKGGAFYMTEDKKGKIWFATYENGVYSYDGESVENFTKKDGLCMNGVTSMLADSKGNMWFGTTYADEKGRTQGCINRYDGKSITTFPVDGLDNSSIWNIFEDKSGNIWIGARNVSLYKYDGRTITDFSEKAAKQ